MQEEQDNSIKWRALEYVYKEKRPDWFFAVGIIALALVIASIIWGNILFSIFIILSVITLFMYAVKKPRSIQCEINKDGIFIDKTHYLYEALDSFWVDKAGGQAKLIIKPKKIFLSYIMISIGDKNPKEIHDYLKKHLKEEEQLEPLSHKIMEYLGF